MVDLASLRRMLRLIELNSVFWCYYLGVKTYGDLRDLLKRAHDRVVSSMGTETFQRKVLDILPLTLDNDMLFEMAKEFGWQLQWLEKRKSKKKEQQQEPTAASFFGHNVFDIWTWR